MGTYRNIASAICLLAATNANAQLCNVGDGVLPSSAATANAIGSDGNQFVLITDESRLYTSDDGEAWTERYFSSGIQGVYKIQWTGREFVAMAGRPIHVSTDGITWERQTPNDAFNVVGAAWDGTQTVVTGNYRDGFNLSSRPDGGDWSAIDYDFPSSLSDILWDGEKFIAGGLLGASLNSTDGINWTESSLGDENRGLREIETDGTLIIGFSGSTPLISTNGTEWIEGMYPGVAVTSFLWAGQFIAGGINFAANEAAVAVSDDGVDWELRTVGGEASQINQMASNGSKILAITGPRFQGGPAPRFIELGSDCAEVALYADGFES